MSVLNRIAVQRGLFLGYDLTLLDCPQCGEVFAVGTWVIATRRNDSQSLYCPHGHTMVFSYEKSYEQRQIESLQRQVADAHADAERAQRSREWAESRAKGANIAAGKAKASLSRTLARVHAGICPHCHRTFKQLAAHMNTKHAKQLNG